MFSTKQITKSAKFMILGELKINIRSARWELPNVSFLITERGSIYILGLELQKKVVMNATQRPAP